MPATHLNREKRMPRYFTAWIEERLDALNLTKTDLARDLGITTTAMTKKMRKHQYSLPQVIRIVNKLGATPIDLEELLII